MGSYEDLLGTVDYVIERTRLRIADLSDDEYFWEPVQPCRTIRQQADGTMVSDGPADADDPVQFTNIAWRLDHLIDCVSADRCDTLLGFDADRAPHFMGAASSAQEARERLDIGCAHWRNTITDSTEESLEQLMGEMGGIYAQASRRGFVLHILDEFIHHSAEIALLRDLYTATKA